MLRDLFHPPQSVHRHWHSFHNTWATAIAASLNQQLPPGFFAEPNVQFGIEIDVAAFAENPLEPPHESKPYQPAPPVQMLPFTRTSDVVEVAVYDQRSGPTLSAAIELISPANKDRRAHRDAFVAKVRSLLNDGVGVMLVDVVTERSGNLHDDVAVQLAGDDAPLWGAELYATAYRPVSPLQVWREVLQIGRSLPTLPLWLRGDLGCFPVDLAAAYAAACKDLRIPAVG